MNFSKKRLLWIRIFLGLGAFFALTVGVSVGVALAATRNVENVEIFSEYKPALPSQVVDIEGRLITQFFSEEKRELISIDELPKHLIYALITREDRNFFQHPGISLEGLMRASWNIVKEFISPTGGYFSGGSTITQQLAGHLYADRSDITLKRKLVEAWWALQLERRYTKHEILELYLNKMYFGHNTYGVETASQFYFGHSARNISLAESVMLVIQLASPGLYSPINHPTRAKRVQREILDQMVELGYVEKEEANLSFQRYWDNYDWTRINTSTAYFEREDKAPYFSEYVRIKLDSLLTGTREYNTDGYVIYTTLNLDYQDIADKIMSSGLSTINARYRSGSQARRSTAEEKIIPVIDLLALACNIEDFRLAGAKQQKQMREKYYKSLNPMLDVISLMFAAEPENEIKTLTRDVYLKRAIEEERTTVEGALITIEHGTGHIKAMVGGSKFEGTNQFNRAVQSKVEPGSSFKPLYYSAAIDSGKFTPATLISDSPVVFINDDGSPFTPLNYRGEWKGKVLLRYALAHSMNVPSLRVFDTIGFDAALSRAGLLLGIPEREWIERGLVRKYPVGLGVAAVAPIEMARAFSIFANQGKEVSPIAIRYIEDRNGKRILEPERELRKEQLANGDDIQLISPQTAYIMVDLLCSTVKSGTLRYPTNFGNLFNMPVAGKTGTTQNWSDAWTVGFSPYMTTAVWFGFDHGGESLGVNQTGATAAGPIWAEYMAEIHKNLEPKEFEKPTTGLVEATVSTKTGLLPPADYEGPVRTELFLEGTEPQRFDKSREKNQEDTLLLAQKLQDPLFNLDLESDSDIDPRREDILQGLSELELDDLGLEEELDQSDEREEEDSREEESNPLLD